jgi:hypothetical protein
LPAIPDVMDTWATSSLTPQIVGGWLGDDDLFARVFPMDLRPQAHDIIRTWLFTTVLARASRARHAAVETRCAVRVHYRSGSQEDVEVERQRRHADGDARRSTGPTACATGRLALVLGQTPSSSQAR